METPASKRKVAGEEDSGSPSTRNQSPLVITSPGGNVSTRGKAFFRIDSSYGCKALKASNANSVNNDENCENHCNYRSRAGIPMQIHSRLHSARSCAHLQITPLNAANKETSSLFGLCSPSRHLQTPISASRYRPPLSGKKMKLKMRVPTRAIGLEASLSLHSQARKDLSVQHQERIYRDWLNSVLTQPMQRGSKPSMPKIGDGGRLFEVDSNNSTEEVHTKDLCTLSELRERLSTRFTACAREEIITVITQVAKRINDGRLKLKEGCAVLADVGLRKKAMHVLMSYHPSWLHLGLYLVIGENVEGKTVSLEDALEKSFFTHTGIAKEYATNKLVEGLYRHGYEEALGRVILKRILLLVLVLDKLKCAHTLNPTDGIDGLDGGSPLLFRTSAAVKSSRQALQDLLLNAMHGEGDLLSHLGVTGYRLSHVQVSIADYNYQLVDLFEDLQDGVRLCRLAQLMCNDTSILMKLQLPSDGKKRHRHNCGVALKFFSQSGVPLIDEQGLLITPEDIMFSDHERVLFLLWNIFLHLQVPLMLNKNILLQEIHHTSQEQNQNPSSLLFRDLLLSWAKAICETYGFPVDDIRTSFADGQALCYICSYYLPCLLPHHHIISSLHPKKIHNQDEGVNDVARHNLHLVEIVMRRLGCIEGLLVHGESCWDERNMEFALATLCSKLVGKNLKELQTSIEDEHKKNAKMLNSVIVIQSNFRGWLVRRSYSNIRTNILRIQSTWKGHLVRKCISKQNLAALVVQRQWRTRITYMRCTVAATKIQHIWRGVKMRRRKEIAAVVIQARYRCWSIQRSYMRMKCSIRRVKSAWRSYVRSRRDMQERESVACIEKYWRRFLLVREYSATKLQAQWRGWLVRRWMAKINGAAVSIQRSYRLFQERSLYLSYRRSVIVIQRLWRVRVQRHSECALKIQKCYRRWTVRRQCLKVVKAAVAIQSSFRGWKNRKRIESEGKMQKYNNVDEDRIFCARQVVAKQMRMVRERRFFLRMKRCVEVIQKWWKIRRIFLKRKKESQILKLRNISAKLVQAHWRGHVARKQQSEQMVEIRSRIEATAAAVDSNMTLGNRLNAALAVLLSYKTVTGILHICATIDMATQHSRYCCERIAEGGAIVKLVQLIQTTNRSTPHEQVLKHALSILGNLGRFPNLARKILDTPGCVATVSEQLQMFRNKEEIFFKAMQVVKQVMCLDVGVVVEKVPLIVRRLHHVAQLVDKKVEAERRSMERGVDVDKKLKLAKMQLQATLSILKILNKFNYVNKSISKASTRIPFREIKNK